ncbi:MAG: DsbA family protein [bacterium]
MLKNEKISSSYNNIIIIIILCLTLILIFTCCEKDTEIKDNAVNTEVGKLIGYPDLNSFIKRMSFEVKQDLRNKLNDYLKKEKLDINEGKGYVTGDPEALYRIIEITDFNCSHCKELSEILYYLSKRLGNHIYIESRLFPLDKECNPKVSDASPFNDKGGCQLAKASICAGKQGKFFEFKHSLFSHMYYDYRNRIKSAIDETNLNKKKFDECMLSDYPEKKLDESIKSAVSLNIRGTPMLIWNNKEIPVNRILIVAMLLSYNNPQHKTFKKLLPPLNEE